MAFTAEQQAQIDVQNAIDQGRRDHETVQQARLARLEAVRLAKEVLIENARSKSVDERDVTAADITAFAAVLITTING